MSMPVTVVLPVFVMMNFLAVEAASPAPEAAVKIPFCANTSVDKEMLNGELVTFSRFALLG